MADIPYTFPSPEAKAELGARIKEHLRTRTSDEWTALFLEDGGCGGERFGTVREYMEHPQAKHNGIVVEVDDPRVGRMKQIAPLRDLPGHTVTGAGRRRRSSTSTAAKRSPSPPGHFPPPVTPSMAAAHAARPPLEGVTVLELASYYAAPFGATLLADLGARVIKIEPPGGDAMRRLPESSTKTIQGKESVAVDLKTERGREILAPPRRAGGRPDAQLPARGRRAPRSRLRDGLGGEPAPRLSVRRLLRFVGAVPPAARLPSHGLGRRRLGSAGRGPRQPANGREPRRSRRGARRGDGAAPRAPRRAAQREGPVHRDADDHHRGLRGLRRAARLRRLPRRAVRRRRAAGLSRPLPPLPDGRQRMGLPRLPPGGRMAAAVRGHRAGRSRTGPSLRIP